MYSFHTQQPLLRPYVKQIYCYTLRAGHMASMAIVPTGNIFLAVLWGDDAHFIQKPNMNTQAAKGGIIVSGQRLEIGELWVKKGEVNIIGFELIPNFIYQFFGISQQEITGQVLKLEDLWCKEARQIYHQIVEQPNLLDRITVLEQFLCQRIISNEWKKNWIVDQAIHLINQYYGTLAISKLTNILQISSRSLERKFLQTVGVSPKAYCKIIQFNYAFRQMALYKKHVLDVVADTGYYDQSHFANHFRKLFGISPGQFLEQQENFLYFFKKNEIQYGMHSITDPLAHIKKLYVF